MALGKQSHVWNVEIAVKEIVGNATRDLRADGMTMVIATHEMGFARQSADLVAFVADGSIGECAPAEAFFSNPSTPATRKFLAKILKY